MTEYIVKVYEDRTEWFNKEGDLHREDGPAIEWSSVYKAWWLNGKLHRENGPAIEWANGDKHWFLNGIYLTEKEFNQRMNKSSCDGREVEIDGKTYILKLK